MSGIIGKDSNAEYKITAPSLHLLSEQTLPYTFIIGKPAEVKRFHLTWRIMQYIPSLAADDTLNMHSYLLLIYI